MELVGGEAAECGQCDPAGGVTEDESFLFEGPTGCAGQAGGCGASRLAAISAHGMQIASSDRFALLRTVQTKSWSLMDASTA